MPKPSNVVVLKLFRFCRLITYVQLVYFNVQGSPAYDALCSKQTSHTLTGARPQPLSGTGAALEEQPSQKPSPHARQ